MAKRSILFIATILLIAATVYLTDSTKESDSYRAVKGEELQETDSSLLLIPEPQYMYGIAIDSLEIIENIVKPNQSLSQILGNFNVSFEVIHKLAQQSRNVFDVRKINARKKYTIFQHKDSLKTLHAMVYEPSPMEYIVFKFVDSLMVYKQTKDILIKERSMAGVINSSLYEDMLKQGGSAELVDMVADMFGWQLDFTKIFPGDRYKVIYEVKEVDGVEIGINRVLAANFEHYNNDFFGFYFNQGNGADYFDEDGKSLRKAFLRYPVKFTRISSRYTLNRYHPVTKRNKPHLGTDYAAPVGTPIHAAGDGIVTKAAFEKYNGNNVKIKHNGTYETQYLHMSKIASGIKPGQKVKQGQVIGYVGSTGLATGPHLCYRFWKNGKQVDGLKVELPPSEPIYEQNSHGFGMWASEMRARLQELKFPMEEQPMLATTEESIKMGFSN